MRVRATTTQPGTGSAPPDRPVPAPRGTRARPFSHASFTTATTSAVEAGRTTSPGMTRKLVSPSHSYVRRSDGLEMQFFAPTSADIRATTSREIGTAVSAFSYGGLAGFLGIIWIVLAAMFLYTMTVITGKFEIVKESIIHISFDRRLQVLLIAFSFGALLAGTSGFGTPVAIAGAPKPDVP